MVLRNCQATQLSDSDGKSKWVVKTPEGEEVCELPSHWNEKDVMAAIHFARDFEGRAYADGRAITLQYMETKIKGMELNYNSIIAGLKEENTRLASVIENRDIFKEE